MNLFVRKSIDLWQKLYDRPKYAALFLGALTGLAYAPFHFFPAAILAFSGFVVLMDHKDLKARPLFYGWLFGFTHFLFSMYWIANAPKTIGMWYITPLVWIFGPAGLSLFIAPVVYLTQRFSKNALSKVVLFALLWSVAEYARGHMTALPWDLNGYVWGIDVLQSTSIIGIYGLSALTTLLFVSLASRSRFFVSCMVILFVALWGAGKYRLHMNPTELSGVNMRIIQPCIPQNLKWQMDHFEENITKQLALSVLEAERPLKAIIWPEASVPTFFVEYPNILEALADVAPRHGYLIVGGPRRTGKGEADHIHTSSMTIDDRGKVRAVTDKSHLVPFGEYMPFKKVMPLPKLTPGQKDYSPGQGKVVSEVKGLPSFTALICFDVIFPGDIVGENRPHWLLNQTNDAWYGHSTGPYQHLQIVRVRAIEEGLPMVRVANNGISAIIDPYGRILSRLEYDEPGFIDFDLPKRLESATFYAKTRDNLYYLTLLFFLILCIIFSKFSIGNKNG